MTLSLFLQAIFKFLSGALLLSALLFLPAGTFSYPEAWLFLGILLIPMLLFGIFLMFQNPELLKKRLSAKEKRSAQSFVIRCSSLMFLAGFLLAGFNFRFQWIVLPPWVSYTAAAVFLLFYVLYAEVVRENTFLSRTIEIQKNQRVIDTGLYGIVRHPMYSVTVVLFLSMPFVLGSLPSFFVFFIYPFLIVKRIQDEELLLEKELDGYKAYQQKVRYRLFPFLW